MMCSSYTLQHNNGFHIVRSIIRGITIIQKLRCDKGLFRIKFPEKEKVKMAEKVL